MPLKKVDNQKRQRPCPGPVYQESANILKRYYENNFGNLFSNVD